MGWKVNDHLIYWISLLMIFILIDKIGLAFGYWAYQYNVFFDEVLKYVFEWVAPIFAYSLVLLIGTEIFVRLKLNRTFSFILSLLIFVTLIGIFTEYVNSYSNSWTILKMPLVNYAIGKYFIMFQTIGYWVMSVIPLVIYKIILLTRKETV